MALPPLIAYFCSIVRVCDEYVFVNCVVRLKCAVGKCLISLHFQTVCVCVLSPVV